MKDKSIFKNENLITLIKILEFNPEKIQKLNLSIDNKNEVIDLLKHTQITKCYHFLPEELQNDRDIIKTVLKTHPAILRKEWYTKNINKDKELVLIVLAQYGDMYKHIPDVLKNDKEVLKTALTNSSQFFYSIPAALKKDREIISMALTKDIFNSVYEHLSPKYKKDEKLFLEAMKTNWKIITNLPDSLTNKKEFIYQALLDDPTQKTIVCWIGQKLQKELNECMSVELSKEEISNKKKTLIYIEYLEKLILKDNLNKSLFQKQKKVRPKI